MYMRLSGVYVGFRWDFLLWLGQWYWEYSWGQYLINWDLNLKYSWEYYWEYEWEWYNIALWYLNIAIENIRQLLFTDDWPDFFAGRVGWSISRWVIFIFRTKSKHFWNMDIMSLCHNCLCKFEHVTCNWSFRGRHARELDQCVAFAALGEVVMISIASYSITRGIKESLSISK